MAFQEANSSLEHVEDGKPGASASATHGCTEWGSCCILLTLKGSYSQRYQNKKPSPAESGNLLYVSATLYTHIVDAP